MHGWPETWYAWRLVMPVLARDFEVIAVDQRGMGLSDKRSFQWFPRCAPIRRGGRHSSEGWSAGRPVPVVRAADARRPEPSG